MFIMQSVVVCCFVWEILISIICDPVAAKKKKRRKLQRGEKILSKTAIETLYNNYSNISE